jgi:aryl-alcohol dehydrogenase-like predicted oxidoreductase
MRQLVLPGTGVCVSRLSFGTASLHHLPTSRARQNLLAAAYDCGFTHFDAAPSYGFGIAEHELGRFISGRPGRITVATKIGRYAPLGARCSSSSVWARKVAGRLFPACSRAVVDWSLAAAIRSLDESLRRLKTGHIDLLLLHEPVHDALDSDVFLSWFENEHARGRIRAWGLAGPVDCMGPLLANKALGMVLQIHDSVEDREADLVTRQGRELQITYGYLSSFRASCAAKQVTAPLKTALRRNVTGSVLVSTRRPDRVKQLVAIAESSESKSQSTPGDCNWLA